MGGLFPVRSRFSLCKPRSTEEVEARGVEPLSPKGKAFILPRPDPFRGNLILRLVGRTGTVPGLFPLMASIVERSDSRFWIACFGRSKRSTKIPVKGKDSEETKKNRQKAQAIADAWETAAIGDKTQNQIRRVMVETYETVKKAKLDLPTPKTFGEKWLAGKANKCAPATIHFYKATLDRFLLWLGKRAELPLEDIHQDDVEQFLSDRREKVGPVTVNHELKSLRTFFRAARAARILSDNPAEFIAPDKEKTVIRRPFTMDEIRAILSVADPEWRSMVICALYTGQRLADIATLTWQNFDLSANEMRLAVRKTGRILQVPLPPPLRRHLEALPRPATLREPLHPRAYANVVEKGRANALSREFGEVMADAGLRAHQKHRKVKRGRDGAHERQEVSFHTFRRTATTWLHEAGVAPAVVQALIGHDSIDEHQGYIGIGKAALLDAVTKYPEL